MQAARTLSRRVGLVLEYHLHAHPLRLVGDHPAHLAGNPLVDALIGAGPIVPPLPQIPHIAHDHRLHPARVEGEEEGGRLFV